MPHVSTKTYGHDLGFSTAFRQWRADSHCRFVHGYALGFRLEFIATELDHRNWVVDFGGLKCLKAELEKFFDHKTIVARDDPNLAYFVQGDQLGILQLIVLDHVGCEAFAKMVYELTSAWLVEKKYWPRVKLKGVEVMEHGANSAIYYE